MTDAEKLQTVEAQLDTLRELAAIAKNAASAPDYDEEAIRDDLWALVAAALAEVAAPEEKP